ncbi:histone H4 [Echinococcus multilocularis]|uniref:Histone H4 n=1 Tax=Echinococcus multilocularis TaxID=6211 RepID=A0A068Y3J1_ECHMU|nr:histone H4 [Echinococcus multilocularis]
MPGKGLEWVQPSVPGRCCVTTSRASGSLQSDVWRAKVETVAISGLIFDETRGVLKDMLENVIRDLVASTEHTKRKIITAMD